MKPLNLLAMDFGASNGRGIIGEFDGEKLRMKELHRFENDVVNLNGVKYWNSMHLYAQILESIKRFSKEYGDGLSGIGIDTWGVDYGLLDGQGRVCAMPISYRMATDDEMLETWKTVSKQELFSKTGIAANCFNTVYQLHSRKRNGDAALQTAEKLLLLPDLFAYFLCGETGSEYTNTTTTQLYNPATKDWDWDIIKKLGLPANIFQPIQQSCNIRGTLFGSIAEDCGVGRAKILAIGSHDTASAVAAVPGRGDFAYISSGTWSLLGFETDNPIISDAALESNFSNEGTIQGGFRPLKNIAGLWIIQECRREWMKEGMNFSWDDIVTQAIAAPPLKSLIDPDDSLFYAPDSMLGSIREYCSKTAQEAPQSVGEIARCVYESLALKYRWVIDRAEEIAGKRFNALNIVGGGCQNKLLNQMAANATNREVLAGPIESACIGNLLGQAMALGEIGNMSQLRDVVRNSFDVETYAPVDTQIWEDAYGRFVSLPKIS